MISLLMFILSNASDQTTWIISSLFLIFITSTPEGGFWPPSLFPDHHSHRTHINNPNHTSLNQSAVSAASAPTPSQPLRQRQPRSRAAECRYKKYADIMDERGRGSAAASAPILPASIAALEIDMPSFQSFPGLDRYQPHDPFVHVDGRHAVVTTHTGYIVFYMWVDYVDAGYSESDEGYWRQSSVFYNAEINDNNAQVAISGNTAALAMPDGDTQYGRHAGIVHTYTFNDDTEAWTDKGALTPYYFASGFNITTTSGAFNDQTDHAFGASVDLQDDLLVVGAPGANNLVGATYVFTRNALHPKGNAMWNQTQQLTPQDKELTCPNPLFGVGLQLSKGLLAARSNCNDAWMALYQYHPGGNKLEPIEIQDEAMLVRHYVNTLMDATTTAVAQDYFVYSMPDHGVYIYEKKKASNKFTDVPESRLQFKQFIDSAPYNDSGFGSHMIMDQNLLIICGNYRIFFFASNDEELWELVLTFPIPRAGRGIAFSDGQLALLGRDNVYSMNLKKLLQITLECHARQPPSRVGMKDGVVEVDIMPDSSLSSLQHASSISQ